MEYGQKYLENICEMLFKMTIVSTALEQLQQTSNNMFSKQAVEFSIYRTICLRQEP